MPDPKIANEESFTHSWRAGDPLLSKWKSQIGQYPGNDEFRTEFEKLGPHERRKLLGNKETRTPLLANKKSQTTARAKFLDYLHDKLQTLPPNSQTANSTTISMEALLGKEGIKLYKDAISEENHSYEFRKAVFNKSTTLYEGDKWDKKLVLWVGGPSASGKSFGTQNAVKEMSEVMSSDKGNPSGNLVVSVDGGIERELSQMRQMVLQTALAKGYKGIEDLHANTKLTVKKSVQNAALADPRLNVVIPETFTTGLRAKLMSKINKMENTIQAYSEVNAPNHQIRFKNTVALMGNLRAWNTKEFKEDHIQMNNLKIGCESKVYEADNFKWGKIASAMAKSNYEKICKNPIVIAINHDLLYMKKVENSWVKCQASKDVDTPNKLLITKRDYQNWKAYLSGEMVAPPQADKKANDVIAGLNTHASAGNTLDLKEWKEYAEKNKLLYPQKISLKTHSQNEQNLTPPTNLLKRQGIKIPSSSPNTQENKEEIKAEKQAFTQKTNKQPSFMAMKDRLSFLSKEKPFSPKLKDEMIKDPKQEVSTAAPKKPTLTWMKEKLSSLSNKEKPFTANFNKEPLNHSDQSSIGPRKPKHS